MIAPSNHSQMGAKSMQSASKKEGWMQHSSSIWRMIAAFILHMEDDSKFGGWFQIELNYHHPTSKKRFFSQIAPIISSTLLTFLPYILGCFTPKRSKRLIFPPIAPIIWGTFLHFLTDKRDYGYNHRTFWCVNIVSSPKTRKHIELALCRVLILVWPSAISTRAVASSIYFPGLRWW